MKGFIVYAHYKVLEDQTKVIFAGKLENGESFITTNTIIPYFFIKKSDVKKNTSFLTKYTIEETKEKTFAGEAVTKISHPSQTELNKISEVLHKKNVDTYEADVKPHTRFIIDNNLLGSIIIKGDHDPGERVNRIYYDPEIKPAVYTPQLKTLAIDIESDHNADTLFCIGLYSEKYQKVFIVTDKKLANAVSCANEADCLEKVKKEIIKIDPDIITGWNIADFDFPYLKQRFEKNKISFDIGRDTSETRMRITGDFFRDSTVTIMGRQVLDGLNLIKDPFIKEAPSIKNADFESWTLEDVSQALLNEGKTIVGKERHAEIERLYRSKESSAQQKLVDYNLQDCKLAYNILEKTKTLDLAIERSQLTGLPLDRLSASIAAFDSLYIREARMRGLVSPTTRYSNKEERIKGGYVMDSIAGIYHNVLVLDFKSLYPSIIKTFNIDPASFVDKKEKNTVEAPNGAHFKNEHGVLPSLIEKLHEARERAKKEERELASYAIKIIMNSFFGVLANPTCRYFSLDIANAITHFAQHIVKLTAEKIREKNYNVMYSDTDSVFVETKEGHAESEKTGKALTKYVNEFYKHHIQTTYNRTSYLELEFKRHYLSFLLPPIRGSEKGSKKRYAGLMETKGKEELEIVGLEAIRGDWTEAAQEFQRELLMHIFKRKEFVAFIKEYVKKIQSGKLDEKLIYRKSIRKELDEYVKTTPPHVKAARKLDKLESNIIEYYMTEDGPEPLQKLKHKIDYDHYINKQIAPIANTILFFFKRDFEEILKESKQTKLFT